MPVYPAAAIAPGDPGYLVEEDYQYEFRALLFGHGTDFQTETVEGILGLPSARTSDTARDEDHGDYPGVDLMPGRTVNIKMNILGTVGDIQEKIALAAKTFQISKRRAFEEFPFVTKRPGQNPRYLWARARRAEFPSNYDTARGKAKGAVQLYATDPRWYSLEESLADITIAAAGANEQGNVETFGDLEDGTFPVIEIEGPCTNPRITNVTDDGRAIRIDVVVPIGQTLVIDTKAKTVFLNGVDRFDTVRGDNQWWVLLPDDNTVIYNRTGGGIASRCRLRWHDAWASA